MPNTLTRSNPKSRHSLRCTETGNFYIRTTPQIQINILYFARWGLLLKMLSSLLVEGSLRMGSHPFAFGGNVGSNHVGPVVVLFNHLGARPHTGCLLRGTVRASGSSNLPSPRPRKRFPERLQGSAIKQPTPGEVCFVSSSARPIVSTKWGREYGQRVLRFS